MEEQIFCPFTREKCKSRSYTLATVAVCKFHDEHNEEPCLIKQAVDRILSREDAPEPPEVPFDV